MSVEAIEPKPEMAPSQPLYVISADLHGPMNKWGLNNRFAVPNASWFQGLVGELSQDMKAHFPGGVEVVPEAQLADWMLQSALTSRLPVITLDPIYIDPQNTRNVVAEIAATRAVDATFNDLGLLARAGTEPLTSQIDQTVATLRRLGATDVALLDDVVFSGESHARLAQQLGERGISVRALYAGVSIGEGAGVLRQRGIDVSYLRQFDSVVDEVCERDFRPGTPNSGRVVVSSHVDGRIDSWNSAPYILPFGNPGKWASIPDEYAPQFSELCLEQAVQLWTWVEQRSNKSVRMGELPRKLTLAGVAEDVSVVKALRDAKATLKG